MKKVFFMLSFIFLATMSFAQVGTGLFVGGQLGFSTSNTKFKTASTTTDGAKTSAFNLSPRVGYFLTDNLGAGIVFGYNSSKTTNENEVFGVVTKTENVSSGWSAGLFGRYAMGLGDGTTFFLVGDLNFMLSGQNGKNITTIGGTETTTKADPQSSFSIGVAPAFLFFPTDKIGLEFGLGNLLQFSSTTTTSAANNENKTIVSGLQLLNVGTLGLNIGANYYFSR